MVRYRAICTIPLYFEAENDEDAYAFIKELFDRGQIGYCDVNEVELECREED